MTATTLVKMLTKIGSREYLLISMMMSANFLTYPFSEARILDCPLINEMNEIHTCTVMFWMDCAFVRKKFKALDAVCWNWELVDFDKRHTRVVKTGLNVVYSSGVRSSLVRQVIQNEAFVVSHLSSQLVPFVHPRFPNDSLSNLVPQALEILADVTFHCLFDSKSQHRRDFSHRVAFASDQLSGGDDVDVVVKLQPFVLSCVDHV